MELGEAVAREKRWRVPTLRARIRTGRQAVAVHPGDAPQPRVGQDLARKHHQASKEHRRYSEPKHYIAAMAEIPWRLAPLDDPGLPAFIAQRALPDPASARCELCDRRPRRPLSTVLIVEGPDGLPVPFLTCAECRRTLDELHALLESAGRARPTHQGD